MWSCSVWWTLKAALCSRWDPRILSYHPLTQTPCIPVVFNFAVHKNHLGNFKKLLRPGYYTDQMHSCALGILICIQGSETQPNIPSWVKSIVAAQTILSSWIALVELAVQAFFLCEPAHAVLQGSIERCGRWGGARGTGEEEVREGRGTRETARQGHQQRGLQKCALVISTCHCQTPWWFRHGEELEEARGWHWASAFGVWKTVCEISKE